MLPWPVALLLIAALHAGAAFFLLRLNINNAPEAYYPPGSPAIELRDALRHEFPSDEVLTLVFRGANLYEPSTLRRFDKLTTLLQQQPLVDRVFSVTSMEHIGGTADGFSVGPLVDVNDLGDGGAAAIRERVLADRFAPGLLASRDGRYMALAVRPRPLSDSAQRQAVRAAALAGIDEVGLRDAYVGDAGPLTLDVVQLESMLGDSVVFVPITVSIGMALMWWLIGAVRPVLLGSAAMSTVVAPAIALIPAFGQPYTMASAILPSLLSAYTMATLMHLYAAVQRAQAAGLGQPRAVARALVETRKPGAFNVLTTGAGLLSLLLVPIPPIQVFGAVGAAGTVLVFVTVFYLVPPLMVRWDRKPWPQRASGMGRLGRMASRLTIWTMRRPRLVIAVLVAASVIAVPLAMRTEVESNLLSYFPANHPVNQVTRTVDARFVGVTALEVSLTASQRDAFKEVDRLRWMRAFQDWLESQPEVDRTLSMADLVEEMHWAMNDEQKPFRAVPDKARLVSQYLFVYDGADLYELVNRDFGHARIMVNLNVHGAKQVGQVIERIRERVREVPMAGIAVDVGGHGRLFSDQADLLVEGQLKSFLGAFGQIFLLMAAAWRSVKGATLCLVPNLAPLLFVFALMGATGTHLDMATVMVASVIIGITVDDTIHLFYGFRHRLARGLSPMFAIARSFQVAGRAVLATSILLIAQFALLSQSAFIPTANFGLMTAVGLLAGQAFELLLLPPLLLLFFGGKGTERAKLAKPQARPAATPGARIDAASESSSLLQEEGSASAYPDTLMLPGVDTRVLVCLGQRCRVMGAVGLWADVKHAGERLGLAHTKTPIHLTKTGCLGLCDGAPLVQVYPGGEYLREANADDVIRALLDKKRPAPSV